MGHPGTTTRTALRPLCHDPAPQLGLSESALIEHCYAGGYQALTQGELRAAARWFACLAALEPRGERAWVGLGLALERATRVRHALGAYGLGRSLMHEPSAWLHLGSARCLKALGRAIDAQRELDSAETLTSDPHLQSLIEEER